MKVYLYISQWNNGENFEGSVYGKVFTKIEDARYEMGVECEQAIDMMRAEYDTYYQDCSNEDENNPNHCTIANSYEYRDWWEGTITEQEL